MGKAASKKSATGKSAALDALTYLTEPEKHVPEDVCAVYGDESFLKGEVLAALRHQLLGGRDGEFGLSVFAGREVQLRDVRDALSSVSLFGDGQRVVIVEDADTFVSDHRVELEDYVASRCREPSDTRSASARPRSGSVLILDVKTWPSNTRLAKAVAASGLAISCDAPKDRQAKSWLTQRAKAVHNVRLDAAAADALLELVPPELGILVQEIAKLALVVGPDRVIDVKLVQENVGGWRTRATWDMIDAAADGRAADALGQLDRLMTSGEKPFGLLPQMASSLRRFPTAVQLIEAAEKNRQRLPPREALAQAGVIPFKLGDAERQLRQIGRQRAKQLTEWLLAADLAMKGHNSSDERARMEIERLIIRLAAGEKVGPPSRGRPGPAQLAASTRP
jgi:DNA polymerase-3 subunit delta